MDQEKLSNEFVHHGFNVSPKQISELLIQREILYGMANITIKDRYQLIRGLFDNLNIFYADCEMWEMFFEPPMYWIN